MSRSEAFPHLLSSGRIGTLELRNRIVMAPMGSNLAEADGQVGERMKRYFEARARGGVGMVIVGVGAVAYPAGACLPHQVAISDDAFLPGLGDLAARVHAHGAKIAIQLQHAGKVATQDIAAGRPMWVPSEPSPEAGDLLEALSPDEVQRMIAGFVRPGARMSHHAMTRDDIRTLVAQFADAADRARRAGFDGVELHAAHGYLIASFLSPAVNRRDDEYGGSLENRARLLVEVIRAVRERVGAGFPVWCRLDGKEMHIEGGITIEDARRTAEIAAAAGADAIHVSAYAKATIGAAFTEAPLVHEPCGYVPLAEGVKRRVGVPVIAVGRIAPADAERVIAEGQADFVAMARRLLADPELARKLAEGRPEDIRPCIYCYTCVGQIFLNEAVTCAANPATGREADFEITAAARPRRVLVVGGGAAGMEAARVAALRGHRVTLCERSDALGGTLRFAALVYEPNAALLSYLEAQVRKLGVELRLGTKVERSLVEALAPEVVIVATGARRRRPAIPGVDRPNVLDGDGLRALLEGGGGDAPVAPKLSVAQQALVGVGRALGVAHRPALARQLSRLWLPLGTRVAIVGGGLVGVELAEFLSERGRQVTVLEEDERPALEMALPRRWRVLHELRERGVELLAGARVEAIGDNGVVYRKDGESRTAATDTVILAAGVEADPQLGDDLRGLGVELHLVGDCASVGYLEGALRDATRVACAI